MAVSSKFALDNSYFLSANLIYLQRRIFLFLKEQIQIYFEFLFFRNERFEILSFSNLVLELTLSVVGVV